MLLKVCGMRERENIYSVSQLKPDLMGFIFYRNSKRFVSDLNQRDLNNLHGIEKVGVFVNQDLKEVVGIVKKFTPAFEALFDHDSDRPDQGALLTRIGKRTPFGGSSPRASIGP